MDDKREARLRNAVARIMNAGLRTEVVAPDGTVSPDDLFVWEVIKTVRNSAFNDAREVIDRLRIRD